MNQGLIPRRYAKALYKVATERGVAERMYELMNSLSATFEADNGLRSAVDNPFVPVADKTSLLITAAGATDADTTYVDFLKLLVENRRVDIIEAIARAYTDLYRKEGNIRRVEVVSAAPLAPEAMERIRALVASNIKGASMEFSSRVDPALIGGFVVNIDNQRLDASVANELKELRLSLIS